MFFVDILGEAAGQAPPSGIAAELIYDGDPPGSFRLDLDVVAARSAAAAFAAASVAPASGAVSLAAAFVALQSTGAASVMRAASGAR